MAKEIERKFLLSGKSAIPIPAVFEKRLIKQGYVALEKDQQVRIRISKYGKENISEIGIKFIGELVRDEFEYVISNEDAKILYKKCKFTIEKERLSFESHFMKGVYYDVDVFPNGMKYVEVEFDSVKTMKKWEKDIPQWIGKEISGIRKYSNITLAKQNLRFK